MTCMIMRLTPTTYFLKYKPGATARHETIRSNDNTQNIIQESHHSYVQHKIMNQAANLQTYAA